MEKADPQIRLITIQDRDIAELLGQDPETNLLRLSKLQLLHNFPCFCQLTTYLEIEVGAGNFNGPLRQVLAAARTVEQIQLKQSWVEVVSNQPNLSRLLVHREEQPLLKLTYLLADQGVPIAVETLWLPTEGSSFAIKAVQLKSQVNQAMSKAEPLLQVYDLVKHFPISKGMLLSKQVGAVKAVDGISFTIMPGKLSDLSVSRDVASRPPACSCSG